MYLFPEMIDSGLPKGAEWPTDYHRQVAIKLLIANPEVTNMYLLQTGVTNILNVPQDKIKELTIDELSNYGFEVLTSVRPRI
jgi:hypothetical protein